MPSSGRTTGVDWARLDDHLRRFEREMRSDIRSRSNGDYTYETRTLQRLKVLRSELETAQRNADAERAFAVTGATNPWTGASEKLDSLHGNRRNGVAKVRRGIGRETRTLARLRCRVSESARGANPCGRSGACCSRACSRAAMAESGFDSRAIGVAYDFAGVFSAWYLSGKEKFAGAPQSTKHFMQDGPPGLRFAEKDRPAIIAWHQARGAAQSALVHWDALAQQRAHLLREAPELSSVA